MLLGLFAQRSEMTQVNGVVYIIDFTGATTKHFSSLMGNKDIQNWHKKWQVWILGSNLGVSPSQDRL